MRDAPETMNPSDSGESQQGAGLPEPALAARAIAHVLQPLARLMIDHGLQLPSLVDLLKKALVDEAARTYGLVAKGSSDTRISLLTGVHRKDVRRLRSQFAELTTNTPMVPLAAAVVARWISEPRFLNDDQTARALPRTPGRGTPGEPDFTTLVAEVSSDVGARAVLDELVRLGVVELRDDGCAILKTKAFVPQEGLKESFHFLAANVSEHLEAAVHNLAPDRTTARRLEQSAFSQNLTAQQAQLLHQLARTEWDKSLREFLRVATVAEEISEAADPAAPRHRVRFGVYFNETVQAQAAESEAASPKPRKTKRKTPP